MNRASPLPVVTYVLLGALAPLRVGALYLIFQYAPEERVMGAVQRVFYFHVPAAMVAFVRILSSRGADAARAAISVARSTSRSGATHS